jgi:hypothetical protein
MFNTPYMGNYNRQQLYSENMQAGGIASGGMVGRFGANMLGAGIGAAVGGVGGAIAGFGLSEMSGFGQFGQNMWNNTIGASQAAFAGRTSGMMNMSSAFVNGGGFMADSGMGFSRTAAMDATRQLTNLGGSSQFQRETGGRFNTNDVFRIAQTGSEAGLMSGVSSPTEMTQRVRETAKSLKLVMEMANEPDVRDAIKMMGSLRSMGLNSTQTLDAVTQGRSFARNAGMTFSQLAATGGAMGAQTFSSMGLSQGQGWLSGMHAVGSAQASINNGVLSPQMQALVGGAQGYGGMNSAFSGSMLQTPMWAAMLNGRGGLSADNMRSALSGRSSMFDMAGMASNNFGNMAGRMGVEGIGMALGMQHLAQDSISAAMSPEQQRQMQDRQIMSLSRRMGFHGGAGFMTAAQIMGITGDQATARLTEISDPRYFSQQRDQIEIDRREHSSMIRQAQAANRPGFLGNLNHEFERETGISVSQNWDRGMQRFNQFMSADESTIGGPRTADEARQREATLHSRSFLDTLGQYRPQQQRVTLEDQALLGRAEGGGLLGQIGEILDPRSDADNRMRLRGLREGGNMASTLLTTNASSRTTTSQGDLAKRFMGTAGMSRLASRISSYVSNPNTMGGAGNMTGGSMLNGAISGAISFATDGLMSGGSMAGTHTSSFNTDVRDMVIDEIMRGAPGRTREQAVDIYEQHSTELLGGISQDVMARTGGQGRDILSQVAGIGAEAGVGAHQGIDALAANVEGGAISGSRTQKGGLFGGGSGVGISDRTAREGIRALTGGAIGSNTFGITNRNQLSGARSMAGTMSAAYLATQQGTPEQKAAAARQLERLTTQARETYGEPAAQQMMHIAGEQAMSLHGNVSAEQTAYGMMGNTNLNANDLGNANSRLDTGQMIRDVGRGVSRVFGASSSIRGMFSGVDQQDSTALWARAQQLDRSQLQDMVAHGSPVEREIAQAVLSGQQGQFVSAFAHHGEGARRRDTAAAAARGGGIRGLVHGATAAAGGRTIEEQGEAIGAAASGTAADVEAINREAGVNDEQGAAADAGLSSAVDGFTTAVSEFREAIHEFHEANQSSSVAAFSAIISQNTGH